MEFSNHPIKSPISKSQNKFCDQSSIIQQIEIESMSFRKYVETGRVAFITDGKEEGKLCAIVNIIDQNRVLIDGPCTGIPRQAMSLKRLHLTNFAMKFPWHAPTKTVRKTWAADGIDDKWKNSRWAKRVESRNIKANLTDFERFKLDKARRVRNKMRRKVYMALLLNAKKSGGLVPKRTKPSKKNAAKGPPAKGKGPPAKKAPAKK